MIEGIGPNGLVVGAAVGRTVVGGGSVGRGAAVPGSAGRVLAVWRVELHAATPSTRVSVAAIRRRRMGPSVRGWDGPRVAGDGYRWSMDVFDVVIVGAGISGIGAACHLQRSCPDLSFVILEGRQGIGGTWDLFRYPGVRSDSDMHTLGFEFKPWTADTAIADGPSILAYLNETVDEHDLAGHIRFGHRVRRVEWSTADARWTVRATADGGQPVTIAARFLFICAGYYSYDAGHTPEFAGRQRFTGTVVHPQQWPSDLDHRGARVIVIGSGATAMTLVPALAADAAQVTMVQRSPTYVVSRPSRDVIANVLRRVLPEKLAYRLTRAKNIRLQQLVYRRTRTSPEKVAKVLLKGVRKGLGAQFDIARHFTPTYHPWDQRLCLIPDGDLFAAINSGKAAVVTGQIETFTPGGLRMSDGQQLDADIIVTATGLELVTLGEIAIEIDGVEIDIADTWSYRGLGYSDVPNLFSWFGYINASWTLRADLVSRFACRVLQHMADTGTAVCTPRLRPSDQGMAARPWITDFSAGYIQRVIERLPKQGDRPPWTNPQNYDHDRRTLLGEALSDGVLQFSTARLVEPSSRR